MHGTHKLVRTHTTRNRTILASVVASSAALLAATTLAPANASDSGPMSGRAYGIGLSNITLLGGVLMPSGASPDTGLVQTDDTTDTKPACGNDPGPYITATLLCPEVRTDGDRITVDSVATVATAHVGLPGLPVIDLVGVKAEATASCDNGTTGSTTIDYLRVGGTVVIAQRTVVKPNTTVNLGVVKLILNEQMNSRDGWRIVNAVHVKAGVPGLVTADVVVSSAQAATSSCYLD